MITDMKIGLIDVDGYPKKKRNKPYAYPLKKYREILLKYQEFEEVEEALRIDPDRINLRHVFFFSALYNWMRT